MPGGGLVPWLYSLAQLVACAALARTFCSVAIIEPEKKKLSIAAQNALATMLLDTKLRGGCPEGFDEPCLADVLDAVPEQPIVSRMPLAPAV